MFMENKFYNFDLHIHSVHSTKYEAPKIVSEITNENLDVLLQNLNKHSINVFSITDHNTFNANLYLKAKKEIKKFKKIKNVIAGVEFNVKDQKYNNKNVHLRIYFDISNDVEAHLLENTIQGKKNKKLENKKETKEFLFNTNDISEIIEKVGKNIVFIFDQNSCFTKDKQNKKEAGNWNFLHDNQKWGIATAIETRRIKNKNILETNLREISNRFAIIYGSDCHSWKYYPAHSKDRKSREKFYFSSYCRPTFLGLMFTTIFEKRLYKSFTNGTYIKKIQVNNNEINFSKGMNVIIGENGVGKSAILSILNSEKNNKAKKLIEKENKIFYETNQSIKIKKISQGMLVEKHNEGKLLIDNFNDENKLKNNLRIKLNQINDEVLRWIENKINYHLKLEKVTKKTYPLKLTKKTYFPKIKKIEIKKNIYEERYNNLNKIFQELEQEFQNSIYAIFSKKTYILKHINLIILEINKKKESIKNSNDISQIINSGLESYEALVKDQSTNEDLQSQKFEKQKDDFIKNLIDCLFAIENKDEYPKPKTKILKNDVEKEMQKASYSLKLEYQELKDLNFLEQSKNVLFKKKFNWNKVQNVESLFNNLKHSNCDEKNNFNSFKKEYKQKSEKLINKLLEFKIFIKDIKTLKIARTFGEISRLYYQNILKDENKEYDVIMIDQPEDNISQTSIKDSVCKTLDNLRNEKQLFIVTHNPIIAVNLDPDLIFHINQENGQIKIINGPLDMESFQMIEILSKNLDGGKEKINERIKIYEAK